MDQLVRTLCDQKQVRRKEPLPACRLTAFAMLTLPCDGEQRKPTMTLVESTGAAEPCKSTHRCDGVQQSNA